MLELDDNERKLIKEFESKSKRKAIWKGKFTNRYLGWRDAPKCNVCGKKMRYIYTLNDCCATRRTTRNWSCDTCNRGATEL